MGPDLHQLPDWPEFRWDQEALAAQLAEIRHRQGRLLGRMEGLGFALQREAELETLTLDVVKSSEIEGEHLNPVQVRSSIARRLGLDAGGTDPADRDVEGVVEMMLDATQGFAVPLTANRLFAWHAALFPTGRSGMRKVVVGGWRDDASGPMQVVSGPVGTEKVHYEAPAAPLLPDAMPCFLAWANAAQAHRRGAEGGARASLVRDHSPVRRWQRAYRTRDRRLAARALGEQRAALLQHVGADPHERNEYYDILERTQKGTLDVTHWLEWFLGCLGRAFDATEATLAMVMRKARFWERAARLTLNERQRLVLNRLLDGFTGELTTQKWATLAKCSHDSALRDIQGLIDQGLIRKDEGGGRSTSYSLGFE